jgi:hypothetical protein
VSYADSDYYENTYKGNKIPEADLDSYLQKASDDIDILTYNRIESYYGGFTGLSVFQQNVVKKATCYQADYLYEAGDAIELNSVGSFSILDISVNRGGKDNKVSKFSRSAIALLNTTNLTNRGL